MSYHFFLSAGNNTAKDVKTGTTKKILSFIHFRTTSMNLNRDSIKDAIRAKVMELANNLGGDASALQDEDIIPATGLLDSAGILELVVWYENEYDLPLKQHEINIDNLGSVNAMAEFLLHRKDPGS